ncbi:MAG: CpsD/CapB family tyrosine-protein kinase, partial [Gammaproteobacteria bacterium]
LRQRLADASDAAVVIGEFKRDAEANLLLMKAFVSRHKETSAQQDIELHQANARIISRADIPSEPALPWTRAILAVVFFGSTFIGGVAALFLERRQDSFWSDVQVEEALGIPLLGLAPKIRSLAKMRRTPASYFLQHPRSPFAESIRSICLTLFHAPLEAPPKTVLLASSSRQEGRTTMAASLTRAQALAGKKAVILDTDLSNPTIHQAFGMRAKPGLAEVLSGKAWLEDVLEIDDATGARVIQAGLSIPGTSGILASPRFAELLSTLSKSNDLVILDSPPTTSGPDALILSARVDATVLIVRWGKTNRELAAQALRHFAKFQGRVVGAVLEMVEL